MTLLEQYRDPVALPASEAARISRLLGIRGAEGLDELALADRIAEGLPVSAANGLSAVIPGRPVAGLISEPTLRRARKAGKPLSREQSERLYEFGRVMDAAARTFRGDAGKVARFLWRPNPMLNGRTPFDVARSSSAGAQAVVSLLDSADAGVAA